MIDVRTERAYALKYVRSLFPRRRRGKRPSLPTLYRYASAGYRGVVLETVQVGGTRCTSKEAVARFIERMSGQTPDPHRASADVQRRDARPLDQDLENAGFDRRSSGPPSPSGRRRGAGENRPVSPEEKGTMGIPTHPYPSVERG